MVYINNSAEDQPKDKRRYDRRHSLYYLRIYDGENGELVGNLVDLSEGGMMMVGDNALTPGKVYSFSMQLPSDGDGEKRLAFKASAKWSKRDSNPALYDTGLELVEKSDDLIETIRQLIDAYMFNSY